MAAPSAEERWARLTHAFQSHVRNEQRFLDAYEQLCEGLEDPGTRFLVELILEDERRHHELFERLAATARGDGPDAGLPPAPRPSATEAGHVLEMTERFLEAERNDRTELRELRKELRGIGDDQFTLLVDLMDLDTRKHIAILEYLTDCLRSAR